MGKIIFFICFSWCFTLIWTANAVVLINLIIYCEYNSCLGIASFLQPMIRMVAKLYWIVNIVERIKVLWKCWMTTTWPLFLFSWSKKEINPFKKAEDWCHFIRQTLCWYVILIIYVFFNRLLKMFVFPHLFQPLQRILALCRFKLYYIEDKV